jgi:hypothetical protein
MFFYPYWALFHQPCADEVVPFVRAGRRRSAGTRRDRRHPIRRRVGWTLVQIGLWLAVRSPADVSPSWMNETADGR